MKYVKYFLVSVGTPIPIQKVPEPTEEQINELHQKFTEELAALFETKKHLYLPNSESIRLIILWVWRIIGKGKEARV